VVHDLAAVGMLLGFIGWWLCMQSYCPLKCCNFVTCGYGSISWEGIWDKKTKGVLFKLLILLCHVPLCSFILSAAC
jgi:hypothetical protein